MEMEAVEAIRIVSYGIGVQNRYSAFLDNEDGLIIGGQSKSQQRKQKQANAKGIASMKNVARNEKTELKNCHYAENGSKRKQQAGGVNNQAIKSKNKGSSLAHVVVSYSRNNDKPSERRNFIADQSVEQTEKLARENSYRTINSKLVQSKLRENVAEANGYKPTQSVQLVSNKNSDPQYGQKHKTVSKHQEMYQTRRSQNIVTANKTNMNEVDNSKRRPSSRHINNHNQPNIHKSLNQEENSLRKSRRVTSKHFDDKNSNQLNTDLEKKLSNPNRMPQTNGLSSQKPSKKGLVSKIERTNQTSLYSENNEQIVIPNFSDKFDFPTLG